MSEVNTAAANSAPKKKRRILRNILLILLGLIIVIVCFVMFNASRNIKQMNLAGDKALEEIKAVCEVKAVDCSEFKDIKVYGFMKFDTEQYEVKDLGNLCVMRANGGVMQMLTIVLTPAKKDLPLLSIDYIYMLGNRTAYVEVYDLTVAQDDVCKANIEKLQAVGKDFSALTDTVPTPAWYDAIRPAGSYKKTKAAEDGKILEMMIAYLKTYLAEAGEMDVLPESQIPAKLDALEGYTHRLISEGGVSTDVFKKEIGEDRTKKLFDTVMFGTANYR